MEKKDRDSILTVLYVIFLMVTAPVWVLLECAKKM